MMQARLSHRFALVALVALVIAMATQSASAELWLTANPDETGPALIQAAQDTPAPLAAGDEKQQPDTAPAPNAPAPDGLPPEKIEADVSTRNIDVTAAFTGTEIVVFGTVDNSRQTGPEAGLYDVAVIIQGPPIALTARSKSNVGGLWVNTGSLLFDAVPSFYAVSTTRPLEEIAEPAVLKKLDIGFEHVRMRPRHGRVPTYTPEQLTAYKDAIIRLKQREHLYPRQDFGVGFIGRSLFRTSITLPANVPVSSLKAQVYLFRDGQLLSSFAAPVKLERTGIEAVIYDFARDHAFLYGLATVLLAAAAGLAASFAFRRS